MVFFSELMEISRKGFKISALGHLTGKLRERITTESPLKSARQAAATVSTFQCF